MEITKADAEAILILNRMVSIEEASGDGLRAVKRLSKEGNWDEVVNTEMARRLCNSGVTAAAFVEFMNDHLGGSYQHMCQESLRSACGAESLESLIKLLASMENRGARRIIAEVIAEHPDADQSRLLGLIYKHLKTHFVDCFIRGIFKKNDLSEDVLEKLTGYLRDDASARRLVENEDGGYTTLSNELIYYLRRVGMGLEYLLELAEHTDGYFHAHLLSVIAELHKDELKEIAEI